MKPNILLIMTDQHSPHISGCYGDPLVRTPNLDRLAHDGMRFNETYCASPVCGPSRLSFMTCRTPTHNRVWNNQHLLNPGTPTWAHTLGLAGYETSLIGRMHFEGPDQHHGFENRPCGELFASHPGVTTSRHRFPSGQDRTAVEKSGYGTGEYAWMDQHITEAACDYLKDHRDNDRPFAAVVVYVLPHCPYIAPKDLFDYYHDKVDIPSIEADQPAMIQWYRESRRQDMPIDDVHIRAARAAYYGMVEQVDAMIGRVLQSLADAGHADDTLVIYCSDHGEMLGEHGCWTKNNYYDASVRVPMIARWPGVITPVTTSDTICNLIDLGSTFADVAGAEDTPAWDGRSLLPLMRGDGDDWINETCSEVVDESTDPQIPSRMIRSGRWKLWTHLDSDGSMPVTLFDMQDDRGELHNLADDPAHRDVRDALLTKVLDGWDAAAIQAESMRRRGDRHLLVRWGKKLGPILPEQMAPPPDDLEDDVVIAH
jgi:choline-sulfatase